MERSQYLPQVKDQYEKLPYPLRDPEDEKKRLSITQLEGLDRVNYYCYPGKKDFSKNFRALIAGGGTGDATIYLAEQLRDTEAEIIHVDLSTASIEVAKQRATIRRLDNIKWIQGSLPDIPKLDIGLFDLRRLHQTHCGGRSMDFIHDQPFDGSALFACATISTEKKQVVD